MFSEREYHRSLPDSKFQALICCMKSTFLSSSCAMLSPAPTVCLSLAPKSMTLTPQFPTPHYLLLPCVLSLAQEVKNPPAIQETWVWSLGREDPLEKGMATHSSNLAWRIPWTEEPGGLQSMGLQRVRPDWATNNFISPAPIQAFAIQAC